MSSKYLMLEARGYCADGVRELRRDGRRQGDDYVGAVRATGQASGSASVLWLRRRRARAAT